MKTWKMALLYAAAILVIAMVAGAYGCNTVKKTSTSSVITIDSSHVEQETHETGGQSDSIGHSSESGDYTKETVIEEFQSLDQDLIQVQGDSFPYFVPEPHKQPVAEKIIKRTTIKETGNYLKDRSVQVIKKDTSTDNKLQATDLNKKISDSSSQKQSSRFPVGIIIALGIIVLICVGIFVFKKFIL